MAFLNDTEISTRINSANSLSPACKVVQGSDQRIKSGSLDLSVGEIYVPGKKGGELGAHDNPMRELSLGQGETAIVRTLETVCLPPNCGGIAFPPASMSLAGMLTTNPGHLDPGYAGHLHLTIINMGKSPIKLAKKNRIVRILFYEMNDDSASPYVNDPNANVIDENLLASLSHDFLNVNGRAEDVAQRVVDKTQRFLTVWAPIITAIIALVGTIVTGIVINSQTSPLETRISRIEGRLGGLGADVNLDSVESRIEKIEKKLEE